MFLGVGSALGSGCATGSEAQDPSPPTTHKSQQPALETRVVTGRLVPLAPGATGTRVDYLIVAADSLSASARRWKAFREGSGYRVALVLTRDLVPRGTPPETRSDALRRGIRRHIIARWQARDPTRPLYVLLLGDGHRPLPAWIYQKATSPIVTDNPYADVDGDGIPEVALGRIPALTDAEVDGIRAKVERYESTYRVGPWNRCVHLFAAPGDYGAFVDALIEGAAKELLEQFSYDYDLNVLYGSRGSPAAYPPERFSDQVYELINSGSLFTVYVGHGTDTGPQSGWWNGKRFDIWKVSQLARRLRMRNKTALLLLVTCDMGNFVDQDGFGEKLLRHPQGPPALIAATGVSHPYPNTLLVRELGHLVTNHRVKTAGLLLLQAKARMMQHRDAQREVLDTLADMISTKALQDHLKQTHLRLYVLLGDPALQIRYVSGRAKLRLAVQAPRPGGRLVVTVRFDAPTTGIARFTLETRRKVILGRLEKLPQDGDPRRDRVLLENYRVANDKVVSTRAVQFTNSRARVALPIPRSLPPGQYYVKVYAQDGRTDAMGSLLVHIR